MNKNSGGAFPAGQRVDNPSLKLARRKAVNAQPNPSGWLED
jgi:hypothetical protein